MGQQCAPVDVTDCVQPRLTERPQLIVNCDVATILQPHARQPEPRTVRFATHGHEQPVPGHGAAVLQLDRDLLTVPTHRHSLGADQRVGTKSAKRLPDLLPDERLLVHEQRRSGLDHRHLRPERGPGRRHLHPDHAPAQHQQSLGHLLGSRDLAVGPVADLGESRDRRDRGGAAGREDHSLAREQHVVTEHHAPLAVEPRATAEQLDSAVLQPRQLRGVVEVVNYLVTSSQGSPHIERAGDRLRGARHPPGLVQHLGRAQQRLRRHARVERAFAADQVPLDDRDAPATARCETACGNLTSRARTDYDDIKFAFQSRTEANRTERDANPADPTGLCFGVTDGDGNSRPVRT